jgi:beta-glucosidase
MSPSSRFPIFAVARFGLCTLALAACTHLSDPAKNTGGSGGAGTATGQGGGSSSGLGGGGGGTGPGGGTGGNSGGEIITGTGGATGTDGGSSSGTGGAMVTKTSCTDSVYSDPYTPGYTAAPDPAVQSTLNAMTLVQKMAQIQGTDPGTATAKNYNDIQRSPDDTANGIRGYFYRDAGRGLNLDARQQGRPYVNNYSTVFPAESARGASFDLDLEYRVGQAMGDEVVASQNTMLLAPCMNILRHPYWGRSQETYGEDSYHLGRMASAFTAGLQTYVTGCAKHFAGNNIENGRQTANAQMDEQTLREIYGRHFRMVVRDGGVGCVMAAYNSVNGTKATQNAHLLTDILRNDFGFRGVVISDWWAMPGYQDFPSAQTAQDNAVGALKAGLDIEVPWTLNFGTTTLQAAIAANRLTAADINTSAGRILEQKFRFGSARSSGGFGLKTPTSTMTNGSITNNTDHLALSSEAARKSMVLLKNANNTLPIKTDGSIKRIAVVGADVPYTLQSTTPTSGTLHFATEMAIGDRGSSRVNPDPALVIGPTAGLMAIAATKSITVTSGNSVAAAQAANADFVVVLVGLTPGDEGEQYAIPAGGDRSTLTLPASQDSLVTSVAALGKPMVVVIESGTVVNMPWLSTVPAVVMAWYSGQRGGEALAQLLFGQANFGGKMNVAWPRESDLPPFKSTGTTTVMDYYLGYRYFDKNNITPIFPYGQGLSYSTFTYSNLQVPCSDVTHGGVINVKVDISNTSAVPGDEVVFLFVSFPNTTARRSVKELKGFFRVSLDANQTKRITIPVRVSDLDYFDMATNKWVIENGPVKIMVGPNAGNLMLQDTVTVK